MALPPYTRICLIIGDPIEHSLSPRMHNAAYRFTGLDGAFVYGASRVPPERLVEAIAGVRALGIRGVSVTMPHKEAVIPLLDTIDPTAQQMGAVNTIVNKDGVLTGYNTDWMGIASPLTRALVGNRGSGAKTALILGAGGAARAAAYALQLLSIPFVISSRTDQRAQDLAKEFGGSGIPWDQRDQVTASIVVNATPIGMEGSAQEDLLPSSFWHPSMIAVETIYVPRETAFLRDAQQGGAFTIPGTQMLLWQGVKQFELFTGTIAPVTAMARALDRSVI